MAGLGFRFSLLEAKASARSTLPFCLSSKHMTFLCLAYLVFFLPSEMGLGQRGLCFSALLSQGLR